LIDWLKPKTHNCLFYVYVQYAGHRENVDVILFRESKSFVPPPRQTRCI